MGILDSLAGILMVFGGKETSGPLQALLFQGVIPVTMLVTFLFLKTRYKTLQYIGAATVLLGVFVSIFPNLRGKQTPVWEIVYFSATIPTAISSAYKEHSFKNQFVDVFYLQAWVALFQVCGSVLLFPVNTLPVIGSLNIKQVPSNLWSGLKCFFGIGQNCDGVYYPVVAYAITNLTFNIIALFVMKELSSAVMYIQNAVRLPLISIVFHIHFVIGNGSLPWSHNDIYTFSGLGVILIGLGIYMVSTLRDKKENVVENVKIQDDGDHTGRSRFEVPELIAPSW
eukprot:TRINITY_DN7118_c0_g1_i2.p1 TRINITY_DN7118_c0_g1~~TRINITY_DN7118_c0_g1_i2.p1  ORF type:complete len:283 (+),score=25.38 TRINITY_DN7118_c0_g1_i2:2-850(+)